MVSASMFPFLCTTFQTCLLTKTSASESGLTVSVEPLQGEQCHFIHADCNSGRLSLHMKAQNDPCCDYIVLFVKTRDNSIKEVICFLELKGQRFTHAVKQVINAYTYLKSLTEEHLKKTRHQSLIQGVCICTHSSAPSPKAEQHGRELLAKIFGKENIQIRHGVKRRHELGEFLRKLAQ